MSEYDHRKKLEDQFLTRRELLTKMGNGFALMGLGALMGNEAAFAAPPAGANTAKAGSASLNPLAPKKSPFPAKAKRVIFIFCNGGPSQVDTFDPKPALAKYVGKTLPMEYLSTERKTGSALPSA